MGEQASGTFPGLKSAGMENVNCAEVLMFNTVNDMKGTNHILKHCTLFLPEHITVLKSQCDKTFKKYIFPLVFLGLIQYRITLLLLVHTVFSLLSIEPGAQQM